MKNLIILLWSLSAFAKSPQITRDCFLDPCEIKADFDGDGQLDTASLVQNKAQKKGIQFKMGNGKSFVVGAGRSLGNGGTDFSWMDHWNLHEGPVEQGASTAKPPHLKAAALFVEKKEAASGLIYWDGTKFSWYQQGD